VPKLAAFRLVCPRITIEFDESMTSQDIEQFVLMFRRAAQEVLPGVSMLIREIPELPDVPTKTLCCHARSAPKLSNDPLDGTPHHAVQ
jgi:hypothetical protein